MTDQRTLRRRIATLQDQQARRIAFVERQKADMDAHIEEAQRVLDNLRAQVTIA